MPAGRRRALYEERYRALQNGLMGGVLGFDEKAALKAAEIIVTARANSSSLDDHLFDVMIAATAAANNLTIITRNVSQFGAAGVPFLNPWNDVGG